MHFQIDCNRYATKVNRDSIQMRKIDVQTCKIYVALSKYTFRAKNEWKNESRWMKKKPLHTYYTFRRFNKTLIKATRANFQSMISANFKRRHRCAGIFHIFLPRTGRIFFSRRFFPLFSFFSADFFCTTPNGRPFYQLFPVIRRTGRDTFPRPALLIYGVSYFSFNYMGVWIFSNAWKIHTYRAKVK